MLFYSAKIDKVDQNGGRGAGGGGVTVSAKNLSNTTLIGRAEMHIWSCLVFFFEFVEL